MDETVPQSTKIYSRNHPRRKRTEVSHRTAQCLSGCL